MCPLIGMARERKKKKVTKLVMTPTGLEKADMENSKENEGAKGKQAMEQ